MIGTSALAIWLTLDPAGEADFNGWYPRQHLPERLSVPGFLRGRRYRAAGDGPPYFTLYELAEATVLASAAYLERLNNPTDWTRRVLPMIRGAVRNGCVRLAASEPDTTEQHLLTVRIAPAAGGRAAVRGWLAGEAVATLTGLPGVTGAALLEQETGGTAVVTEERRLYGCEVLGGPPWVALCEVADPRAEAGLREFWRAWSSRLAAEVTVDFYRLMYGLRWI
jgi:hypothetical protein